MAIQLECYWRGPYKHKRDWTIQGIRFRMANTARSFFANINVREDPNQLQRLRFQSIQPYTDARSALYRNCPIAMLKTMRISVIVIYKNQTSNRFIQMNAMPSYFHAGMTYHLSIIHKANEFYMSLTQADQSIPTVVLPKISLETQAVHQPPLSFAERALAENNLYHATRNVWIANYNYKLALEILNHPNNKTRADIRALSELVATQIFLKIIQDFIKQQKYVGALCISDMAHLKPRC